MFGVFGLATCDVVWRCCHHAPPGALGILDFTIDYNRIDIPVIGAQRITNQAMDQLTLCLDATKTECGIGIEALSNGPVQAAQISNETVRAVTRAFIEIARTAGLCHSEVYRLKFGREAILGIAHGQLDQVAATGGVRAWVVHPNTGQIVEHGILKPVHYVRAAALLGCGWQLAAILTSQRYLVRINKQLAALREGINEIKQLIQSVRGGSILGKLNRLTALSETLLILDPDESRRVSDQLETITGGLYEACAASREVLRGQANAIEHLHQAVASRRDELRDVLSGVIDTYRTESILSANALLARIIASGHYWILNGPTALYHANAGALLREVQQFFELKRLIETGTRGRLESLRAQNKCRLDPPGKHKAQPSEKAPTGGTSPAEGAAIAAGIGAGLAAIAAIAVLPLSLVGGGYAAWAVLQQAKAESTARELDRDLKLAVEAVSPLAESVRNAADSLRLSMDRKLGETVGTVEVVARIDASGDITLLRVDDEEECCAPGSAL